MWSVSRRLLLSVTLLLMLFLGLMAGVLDARFRAIANDSLQNLLDAQIVALIASAEPDSAGNLVPQLQDAEARLRTPGSGLYAAVHGDNAQVYWRSPSAAGSLANFGPELEPGARSSLTLRDERGSRLAAVSRGLEWDVEGAGTRRLTFTVASSLESHEAQLRGFRRGMLGGFAVLGGAVLVAIALLLRWALLPLRLLATQIRQVERGNREQLDSRWPVELSGVVGNLNRLLQAERTRIARYRDTLGNLAHSLKTPLAVLRSSVSGNAVPAETVNAQVDRMTQIVEHQLRRAAHSGGASIGAPAMEVLPLAQELRATLLKVHRDKDFALELAIAPDLLFAGDREDLLEALGNLIDNAAKWCRSRVRVSAQLADEAAPAQRLRIVVEDDGPGIAAADRDLVLERGVRTDERTPGHGLGLAMVREMVELHGGRLLVEESPLGGARVEMQLPGRLR